MPISLIDAFERFMLVIGAKVEEDINIAYELWAEARKNMGLKVPALQDLKREEE